MILDQHHWTDPASVVFHHPRVVGGGRTNHVIVGLILHAVERQRFDAPFLAHVEIRILVPAHHMEKKVADISGGFGRQLVRRE